MFDNDGTVRGTVGWNLQLGAAAVHCAMLRRRNRNSDEPVTGSGAVNVSLTSYGKRLSTVWLAIESIGRGTVRPRRLILWLDDEYAVAKPPEPLRRLKERGLEILSCRNYGPHKKYFPYVSQMLTDEPDVPLVTADDDVLYPPAWLQELMAAHHQGQVTAFRARIRTDEPYKDWPLCDAVATPLDRTFATGVSGAAYPREVLMALRNRGEEFMSACPRADDFWLHYAAVKVGVPVRQVRKNAAEWWSIPSTIFDGLHRENLAANDKIHQSTRAAWLGPSTPNE